MSKDRVQRNIRKFKVDYNKIYSNGTGYASHKMVYYIIGGFILLSIGVLVYLAMYFNKIYASLNSQDFMFILMMVVFFLLVVSAISLYAYEKTKQNHDTIKQIAFLNTKSEIGNWNYLKRRVSTIRELNNKKNYAFVLFTVNNFNLISGVTNFLLEKRLLNLIGGLLMKSIDEDETSANLVSDYFGMYIHYENRFDLLTRLQILSEDLLSECGQEINCSYLMTFAFGIVMNAENEELTATSQLAELARQTAMSESETQYVFYDDVLQHGIMEKYNLALQLQTAMANHEFELYYQPILNIQEKHVEKCEALIRWNYQGNQLLTPEIFLSQFEDTGFILELDLFVIESVMRRMKKLRNQGKADLIHTINLSFLNFRNDQIVKNLKAYFEQYEISPSLIELELSTKNEKVDMENIVPVLYEVRKLGVKLIIDDYGNDHSLELLCSGAIDGIKLNEKFTQRFIYDPRATIVLKKIVELGASMNVVITAEGIETRQQLDAVIGLDIQYGQGNFLMKVLDEKKFDKYLTKMNG